MVVTVDTGDLALPDRFDYWQHVVSDTFVPLRSEPGDDFDLARFRGRMRSARLGSLQVTEVVATPHVVARGPDLITGANDDYIKVVLQLDGDCLLSQDGRVGRLRAGDFALYDTLRPYRIRLGASFRTVVLLLSRARLLVPAARLAEITARPVRGDRGVGAVLATMLRELVGRLDEFDPMSEVRLADTVVDLINTLFAPEAALAGPETGARVTLLRIKAYIERHLADPGLDPETVAASQYVSTRYLHKLFQREGTTVAGWIRARRLAHCERDLRDPLLLDVPVGTVGARWGLPDPAHFSRLFRAAYGVSPRGYRHGS